MEIFGTSGTGKTQFCMNMTAAVAALGASVCYFDTTSSFNLLRYMQCCDGATAAAKIGSSLDLVRVHDCFMVETLLDGLSSLEKAFSRKDEFAQRLRLIVVDSIAALISPYSKVDRGEPDIGKYYIGVVSNTLKSFARQYDVAVLVTNNESIDWSTGVASPYLGRSWASVPSVSVRFAASMKRGYMASSHYRDGGSGDEHENLIRTRKGGGMSSSLSSNGGDDTNGEDISAAEIMSISATLIKSLKSKVCDN